MKTVLAAVLAALILGSALVLYGERANDAADERAECANRIALFAASGEDIDNLSATAVGHFKKCM